MARKGCHYCKACNEGTTQSCSIEKLLYIYIFIYRMQEIWEARVHSSLDLVAIRYPLSIYDRCFYLLVVCVLPTSQRPDLPMQSCSTTFLGSSIDSDVMWFKDVAKSRKLNISNGAFCQVASLPKYGEHHLCEPQTCAGWLNVWEEKIGQSWSSLSQTFENARAQKLVPLGNPLTDSKQMPSIPRNCNAYPLSDRRW